MTAPQKTAPAQRPVQVSGEAHRALAERMREWSGWPDASLRLGVPEVSPYAECDHNTHTFTANPETLVLNPHRVLNSVTPFRLRQEAVLTGALLHEAGHARYSTWQPRTPEQIAAFTHGDGSPVKPLTMAFARLMEEPRVEGFMARDAAKHGALGLDWTMRASAAHLLPFTEAAADPEQALMDLIGSWALRAGRQLALYSAAAINGVPNWAHHFNRLVEAVILKHLEDKDAIQAPWLSSEVMVKMKQMILRDESDIGPTAFKTYMVDTARDILGILFPETDGEASVSIAVGCAQPGDPSEGEKSEGQPGEGDSSIPEPGESGESGDESGESEGGESPLAVDIAKVLSEVEYESNEQAQSEISEQEGQAPPSGDTSNGAGEDSEGAGGGGWRSPTKDERDVQRGAERFLRDLINPNEASTTNLTDSPSSMVDGAALAAWKAGGQHRDPRFFLRTQREVQPTPPVKIAILVDISGSMDVLQKPSALLSWALANAALDLRNFAGRGQQVESCLIHWGDKARVIQSTGQVLPGIRTAPCNEGTSAMHKALDLVEEQMPGFFDLSADGKPANRLLVQFTDWELFSHTESQSQELLGRGLASGVNMLSIVPGGYREYGSSLSNIMGRIGNPRGKSTVVKYLGKPEQVWHEAAEMLR